MKNRRIVASLHKVQAPADRKEAMLESILCQVDAEYASLDKEQRVDTKHHKTTGNRSLPISKKRWLLTIAACLLLAFTLAACIPKARAAVLMWFGNVFSMQSYMGEESSDRSAEPAIDAVVTKVDNTNRIVTVEDVYASDKAQMLADGFGIVLDETAYMGESIYVTGWLTNTAGKFLLDQYTGGDTWTADGKWIDGTMRLTMQNGEAYHGSLRAHFTEEMEEIADRACNEDPERALNMVYENGRLVTSNPKADALWYKWLENHDVRFVCEFKTDHASPFAVSGKAEANLSFLQSAPVAENEESVTLFRANLGNILIDTDLYRASLVASDEPRQSVALSGTHRMFVTEHNLVGVSRPHVKHYVQDLDMSGVRVTVGSVFFTPAGPKIELQLALPESWTREERVAAAFGNENGGLDFLVLLDGEQLPRYMYQSGTTKQAFGNHEDPFLSASRILADFSISPSDWDGIKTMTLIPYFGWPPELIVERTIDGKRIRNKLVLAPGTIVTLDAMDGSDEALAWDWWQTDIMNDSALIIHLDEYR